MARCEDFPCCGHEVGCCPSFDESGNQTNMVCICGAELPIGNHSSLCQSCLYGDDDDYPFYEDDEEDDDEEWYGGDEDDEPWDGFRDDVDADADALRMAGWGTDEDY